MDDGGGLVVPGQLHRRAAGEDHNYLGVGGGHRLQQTVLIGGQAHVAAVHTLALEDLRQTQIEQHHIGLGGQLDRGLLKACVILAVAQVALGVAHYVQTAGLQAVQRFVQTGGIDQRGTGALIPGLQSHVADDGHPGLGSQRQQIILILQQHSGLCSGLTGHGVVGLLIEVPLAAGGGLMGGQDHVQQLVYPQVDFAFGDLALFQGGHQLPVAVADGAGHLQVAARLDAGGLAVAAAPVGDHKAVKAPLVPEDLGEQVGVLVGVGAVYLVVGGHDGLGMALLDGDLKVGEVQLTQGALIHHAVAGHAQQLLRVGGKVLGTGGDAVFLHAPDEGGGHFAAQVGVLGVVLKVAPVQRAALGVQAGTQQDVDLLAGGLLADGAAAQGGQLLIPAVGDAGGGGEAGGRLTGIDA